MRETLQKVRERERRGVYIFSFVFLSYLFFLSQAVSVDQVEEGQLISSLPDDAFFVFQKSLKYVNN